ncbi:MAG: aminotransferase class I/II-fold pyridoxal phosphate-dependent enzyme [Desulfobacteraceae bacterium]|nr:MAG: aminotransferase class I/II-fold pyridoxal phosphate-dependent enzyme [Desulfobacteraceae bacterium]
MTGVSGFQPFVLERFLSKFENTVAYNLSESGAHPLSLRELLGDDKEVAELLDVEFSYPQTNGIPKLRENIAALYAGATPDHVLVTVGAAEANFISVQTFVGPGDEAVVMLPNYMQIWGVARNLGAQVKAFHLREENNWAPDLDELRAVVTEKTKLIAVCNPNNPTGRILTEAEMDAVVAAADRGGAWLLADEVYGGAERLSDRQTPSFWGRYDKVLAVNSLSKAYALPGLRIGWVVAPPAIVDELWARHDYTTIDATTLGNLLAAKALSPEIRPRIIQRVREYVRRGYPVLEEWLNDHPGIFSIVPPQAAAIAFVRYHLDIHSTDLVERLIREKSVFIIPGDAFGLDRFVRISFGVPQEVLKPALGRIHEMILELQRK